MLPFVIIFWLIMCLIFPALGFFLLVIPLAIVAWLAENLAGPIMIGTLLFLGFTVYRDFWR